MREEAVIQSCGGRLFLDEDIAALIFALGDAWSSTLREVYNRCVVGIEPWFIPGSQSGVRNELIARGWNQREATSMLRSAQGLQRSAIEVAKLQVHDLGDRIADLNRILQKTAPTNKSGLRKSPTPKQYQRRHGLAQRRDILLSRMEHRQLEIDGDQVRLTFGGRKLARAGNDPTASGYASREAWRGAWDRARAGTYFVQGDKQSLAGNYSARIMLAPEDDTLRLRIPEFLRDLNQGKEFLTILITGLVYRRANLEAALAGGTAVSIRLTWKESKQSWYVAASFEPVDTPPVATRPNMLGVDINPDELAWSAVDQAGNPVAFGRISLNPEGTNGQMENRIGEAVKELCLLAKEHNANLACETLDFTRARKDLRYQSPALARKLSSFAYRQILSTLASRCSREGILLVSKNTAFTSVLGQLNYAATLGVSVDQAAACVIARRALGLGERVRPSVARRLAGAQPLRQNTRLLSQAAKALAPLGRKATWDGDGLCRRDILPKWSIGTLLASTSSGTRIRRKPRRSTSHATTTVRVAPAETSTPLAGLQVFAQ
jgi:IS605 OrfB family transposase